MSGGVQKSNNATTSLLFKSAIEYGVLGMSYGVKTFKWDKYSIKRNNFEGKLFQVTVHTGRRLLHSFTS